MPAAPMFRVAHLAPMISIGDAAGRAAGAIGYQRPSSPNRLPLAARQGGAAHRRRGAPPLADKPAPLEAEHPVCAAGRNTFAKRLPATPWNTAANPSHRQAARRERMPADRCEQMRADTSRYERVAKKTLNACTDRVLSDIWHVFLAKSVPNVRQRSVNVRLSTPTSSRHRA